MKKLFSLLSIIGIIAVSNCSSIPENNDPILGTWTALSPEEGNTGKNSITKEEWIFNDVYLGRYQSYSNNSIIYYTDFRWSEEDGKYSIEFGDELVNDVIVSMEISNNPETLTLENGSVFATRE